MRVEVVEARSGRSWLVRDGGREIGLIVISRSGKHGRIFFVAYSREESRCRFNLAAHLTLDAAVARVIAFDAEPNRFLAVSHRVSAEAIERRR